jgi:plasmid stability protein
MRTTLTLDDDVAAKLRTESQRAGRSFRQIVNETLRRGLESRRATAQRRVFPTAGLQGNGPRSR